MELLKILICLTFASYERRPLFFFSFSYYHSNGRRLLGARISILFSSLPEPDVTITDNGHAGQHQPVVSMEHPSRVRCHGVMRSVGRADKEAGSQWR